MDVCDLGDLRLGQAAVDVLPVRFVFVIVGVFLSLEEPLSCCGVDTQTDRQTERQTGPDATALGWGSVRGWAAHWT